MLNKIVEKLEEADKEFVEKKAVGTITVEVNYFKGGRTNFTVGAKQSFINNDRELEK
jgi:hypothetical protein